MTIGEQLQAMSVGIDTKYKSKFIDRTNELLDQNVSETYRFLDASLAFQYGNAVWEQDMPIDLSKPISSTNPLNPEITVQSGEHAYGLMKAYYTTAWFSKEDAYERGIADLERYCS